MSSFSRDVIVAFLTRIMTFPLSLISGLIVARVLGPEGKGVASICTLIPSLTVLFISLDIRVGNVYFTASRKYNVQSIINSSLFISVSLGFIVSVILASLVPILNQRFLDDTHSKELCLAITFPILIMSNSFLSGILLGLRKVIQLSITRVSASFIHAIALLILLRFFSLGTLGAVFAYGLTDLLGLLVNAIWIKREGYRLHLRPQFKVASDLVKYSSKNYFGSIFQMLNYRLDTFIVAYFLDASEVGLYTTAVTFVELLWHIPDSISYVLFPHVSSCTESNSNHFTSSVIRSSLMIMLPIALCMFIGIEWIVPFLFGRRFSGSVLPARILLPGILSLGLWKIICNDLAGRGLPQYKSYGAGIALAFTVALDLILIPRFGIAGAALASSIAYSTATITAIIYFKKITKVRASEILIPAIRDFNRIRSAWINRKSKRVSAGMRER